ncbi:Hypothetical protein NTJ_03846 [Nesidiocoris tenuis]|uniref:Uncharacterized protein n=1 Tax=Nesidiocoris tenuis TaxID=355587 RepID=A0ABN7AG67_9HEMI|nr:Hypothetical protein NTJ_03846 [Nesidiocoris tenuis]
MGGTNRLGGPGARGKREEPGNGGRSLVIGRVEFGRERNRPRRERRIGRPPQDSDTYSHSGKGMLLTGQRRRKGGTMRHPSGRGLGNRGLCVSWDPPRI